MRMTRVTITAAGRVADTARGLARVVDLAPTLTGGPGVTVPGRLEADLDAAGVRAWWAMVDRASQELIDAIQVLAGTREREG